MKHLIAILFYNIQIGSIVMFNKEFEKFNDPANSFYQIRTCFENDKLKIVGIYRRKKGQAFRPNNFFSIGVVLENKYGSREYAGIGAVKPIDNF